MNYLRFFVRKHLHLLEETSTKERGEYFFVFRVCACIQYDSALKTSVCHHVVLKYFLLGSTPEKISSIRHDTTRRLFRGLYSIIPRSYIALFRIMSLDRFFAESEFYQHVLKRFKATEKVLFSVRHFL